MGFGRPAFGATQQRSSIQQIFGRVVIVRADCNSSVGSRDVTGGSAADGKSSNHAEALLPSKIARAAQSAASRPGSVSCSAASWRIRLVRSDRGRALPSFVLADGEHVISRYTLRELLDKLEEFTEWHRVR